MNICSLIYFLRYQFGVWAKEWHVTLLFLLTRGGVLVAICLWFLCWALMGIKAAAILRFKTTVTKPTDLYYFLRSSRLPSNITNKTSIISLNINLSCTIQQSLAICLLESEPPVRSCNVYVLALAAPPDQSAERQKANFLNTLE
jgi:hypothetical protein